jgi:glyoxalase family protein
MESGNEKILGLHHVTAIAGNAKQNYEFYTQVLGLRLVKKTVNLDNPYIHHLFYGDKLGTSGSLLTFFPSDELRIGRRGAGQVTEIGYAVPENSLEFWLQRLKKLKVTTYKVRERFGEQFLTLLDPHGLKLDLIATKEADNYFSSETEAISAQHALKSLRSVTIATSSLQPMSDILINFFGYKLLETHLCRNRFITYAIKNANIIDVIDVPEKSTEDLAPGSVHHVAFRVKDEQALLEYREKLRSAEFDVTEIIHNVYFYSIYFREPGGVLFEISTDNPGFTIDESIDKLATELKLPPQFERMREVINKRLQDLH